MEILFYKKVDILRKITYNIYTDYESVARSAFIFGLTERSWSTDWRGFTPLFLYIEGNTEGYYDRDCYIIMQNVGMSQKDVKASIHSQILTVFFLPLIAAGIHIIFAYPVIEKILAILNLTNTGLYIICTVVCFAVFSLLYVIVYLWTAKLYYGIVRK